MPENHERLVKTRILLVHLQLRKFYEIQCDYLVQTLVILAGVELKKKQTA